VINDVKQHYAAISGMRDYAATNAAVFRHNQEALHDGSPFNKWVRVALGWEAPYL